MRSKDKMLTAQHSTAQHSTAQHSTAVVRYNSVQNIVVKPLVNRHDECLFANGFSILEICE